MSRYSGVAIVLLMLCQFGLILHAQYYFQSGASATSIASNNQGASITIQTVAQPDLQDGSFGFWVGEDLSNGAFVQVGYQIGNQSGNYIYYTNYSKNCISNSCKAGTYINAGDPEWFWEYFPAGYDGSAFYGKIGPDGSAGPIGSFNRYSFVLNGSKWQFYFNNITIGNLSVMASDSGIYYPSAFGEDAGAIQNTTIMQNVSFRDLEYYSNGTFVSVPIAHSYMGYGQDSEHLLEDPYGVREVSNRTNYFEVGSALLTSKNRTLWTSGYYLYVNSSYSTQDASGEYYPDSSVVLSAPAQVYASALIRESFAGWVGTGAGSYTGSEHNVSVTMNDNISELADWKKEYFVNVSSTSQALTVGTGWYAANATLNVSVKNPVFYVDNSSVREVFYKWNSNQSLSNPNATSVRLSLKSPINLMPEFFKEYATTFVVEDGEGNRINVSALDVNGTVVNDSSFLISGNNYKLSYVEYKNTTVYINKSFSVSGPSQVSFIAPVYNISISAKGLFGGEVNATANLTFRNGTSITQSLGNNGILVFRDVPYGYAKGYIEYFGQRSQINIYHGARTSSTFITPLVLLMLILFLSTIFPAVWATSKSRRN